VLYEIVLGDIALCDHVTSVCVNAIVLYELILCYIMLYDRLILIRVQMLWDRVIYGHLMLFCYDRSCFFTLSLYEIKTYVSVTEYSTESRIWNMQKAESFMQRKV